MEVIANSKDGYELVRIPGGTFMMGSPEAEDGHYDDESPLHKVSVPDFYMGRYPVTNEQLRQFLEECKKTTFYDPEIAVAKSRLRDSKPRRPVTNIKQYVAKEYAEWAGLRLPSEAEWEYACRAGTDNRYYFGDDESLLSEYAWYSGNSDKRDHTVGQKKPNAFGLYDMHGNAREWVEDVWNKNYNNAPDDGSVWAYNREIEGLVLRGGGWYDSAVDCRAANRHRYIPSYGGRTGGFRLVMPMKSFVAKRQKFRGKE